MMTTSFVRKVSWCATLLFPFVLFPSGSQAQAGFEIVWDQPQDTTPLQRVSCQMDVTGTATIPDGNHLWVLTHRIDFDDVWVPQSEARIDPKTHQYKARVQFGERRDIGQDFEIALITVNEAEHIGLRNYRRDAMKNGDWKPVDMPPTTSPPQVRKVTKVSHNCD